MLDTNLKRLRQAVLRGEPATVIDGALAPVAETEDPAIIRPLLLMLNDHSDDDGMWSLVHAAEQFSDTVYVGEFLETLPDLVASSGRWASILMMRVLNNDTAKSEAVRQLREAAPDKRRAAASLCEKINNVDPRFLAKTTPLLIAVRS
jgi:hypothetical protein